MDGAIIVGIISSSTVIISTLVYTSWALSNKIAENRRYLSDRLTEQTEKISGLGSEVKGVKDTYHAIHEGCTKIMEMQGERIKRLENIENGKLGATEGRRQAPP